MLARAASRLVRASLVVSLVTTFMAPLCATAGQQSVLPAMVLPHLNLQGQTDETPRPAVGEPTRPRALTPLYLSFAALQVLDAESTLAAVDNGIREANPFLVHVGDNRGAMLAIKAGATIGTVLAMERLWKVNRRAAVITMIAVNFGYAAIVANNYRHARRGPRRRRLRQRMDCA
jgi:hypothetical protein